MRRFLKSIILAAALAMTSSGLRAAQHQRSFAGGSYALELDGAVVGFVSLLEGGNVVGEVVKEPPGDDVFVKKHLSNVGYRDIVIEFGGGMAGPLYDWMKLALQRQDAPRNGALLTVDFNGAVRSRLEFTQAQITEVTFPAADAASKDPSTFILRLTPAATALNRKPGGTAAPNKASAQKLLLSSNFRLSINGLDTSHTTAVEQVTVKLPLLIDASLVCLHCEITPPPPIDFPMVVFTAQESSADSIYQWLDDFVLGGHNDDSAEKEGRLEYLTPNLGTAAFAVNFKHLGVFEVAPVISADAVRPAQTSMYCEQIIFEHFVP